MADESLGGAVAFGLGIVQLILLCLAGAALAIPKLTRAFFGTIGFEAAAVFTAGAIVAIAWTALLR